jgi:hypothetical protein
MSPVPIAIATGTVAKSAGCGLDAGAPDVTPHEYGVFLGVGRYRLPESALGVAVGVRGGFTHG